MRGCGLTLGCAGLVLGYITAGTGISASLVHFAHQAEWAARDSAMLLERKDALFRELARCREIGMSAANDVRCQAAWAESRRRFLDYGAGAKRTALPATNPTEGH